MKPRTIVGSGPARRPLPMGREAVERALRLCTAWRGENPSNAAYGAELNGHHNGNGHPSDWLPEEISRESVDQLRERLRGMP